MLGLADNALYSFSIPSMSLRSTPYFCEMGFLMPFLLLLSANPLRYLINKLCLCKSRLQRRSLVCILVDYYQYVVG